VSPGGRRPGWWGTVGFLLAVAAATVFLYREFVFHGDRMLFGTDMLDQAYQLRKFAVDELRAGRGLPLWNPFVYGGLPFLAVLPGPVFYPTSLLYLAMPLYRAIGWTFVAHTFLSGAFGYFSGRSFGLRRWASAVTGVSFMFGGYLLSTLYGGHDGRLFAMVLIPLAFGLLERGMRSGRAVWFLLLGLVVGAQIFTPHVQVMYFSSLALSAYALFALWTRYRDAGSLRPVLSTAGLYALAFLIAALVGAVQLWPTAGLLELAVRGVPGQEGYAFASSWALPPQELSALLLPDLIGSLDLYWGTNPFKLHTEYLGVLPLLLATIGLICTRRDPRQWFFAAAAALGLLFALGAATPIHRLAYAVVPLIGRFRAPAMMLGPVTFAVALLAGFGWQAIADSREGGGLPWPRILLGSGVLALPLLAAALAPEGLIRWAFHAWFPVGWTREPPAEVLGTLRFGARLGLVVWAATLGAARAVERRRVGEWICAALLILGALDMGRAAGRYLIALPAEQLLPEDPALRRLATEMEPGARAWPLPDSYRPNELMYFAIPAVTGSQNFRLKWYERLVGGLEYANLGGRRVLWSLLDLKYLTTAEQINLPFLTEAAEGRKGRVYRISDTTPHAFFPASVVTVDDSTAALDATLGLVDPLERAVVETWAYAGSPSGSRDADEDGGISAGSGDASIRSYTPNEVVFSVSAERPGLLFVSEIYHPDWGAWIDGNPVPIHRTNVAFRGVHVPEGEHELVFRFRSTSIFVSALVSALTATLTLLAAAWLLLRRRPESDQEEATGSP
jgi:hypothetical protein